MRSFIAWIAPVVLASTHAAAQFSEVEPNDAKTTATLVTLAPGESAAGLSELIDMLDLNRTGIFLNVDGAPLPW